MKLQSYFDMDLGDGRIGLANMSLDASSFLPRAHTADKNLPQFIMAFILPCTLEPACSVRLTNDEPSVKIVRNSRYSTSQKKAYQDRMEAVTKSAIGVIKEHYKVEFMEENDPIDDDGNYFAHLELCGVAHELGTLPMPGREGREPSSIDTDLKLKGYEGIYVCDLSIFPMSPEANPTLTLAALALRLSRTINPRNRFKAQSTSEICVVNSSGEIIRVWVSNLAGVERKYFKPEPVDPGGVFRTARTEGIQESVMVFRLDRHNKESFSSEPELYVGHPGGGRTGVITIL